MNDWDNRFGGNYEIPEPSINPNDPEDVQNLGADGLFPTTLALYGEGVQQPPTNFERLMRLATNMSPNYLGNPSIVRNYGPRPRPGRKYKLLVQVATPQRKSD